MAVEEIFLLNPDITIFHSQAVINEKFGDGIVSAIDFRADVERKEHEKGDRVVIRLDGKWLPHAKF